MTDRENLLAHLRADRDNISLRIGAFESGRTQIHESRKSGLVDITADVLLGLYRQLGEVGADIQQIAAGADL